MRPGRAASGPGARAALALAGLALAAAAFAGLAYGEREQDGNVIATLDGGLSPLRLPRGHLAPVGLELEATLRTADDSVLPRVTKVEIGLPKRGVIDSRGLPTCSLRRLRNAKPEPALRSCRAALVGHGALTAQILLPHQAPFLVHARLLLFNARVKGRPAVLLHAYAARPPTVVVVPVTIRRDRPGRFGTRLVADLPSSLGPWPRFARARMMLSRRYAYRGRSRSFISGSCPIPRRFTAGFLTLARATYTLEGGQEMAVEIVRGCRAR